MESDKICDGGGGEMVAAASPSSAPPLDAAGSTHPTYKEMIVQALTELREPEGATFLSIAKYIGDSFSSVPASHDALLQAHLRRLESEGVLRMNGGFYDLCSSPKQRRGRGRPRKIRSPDATLAPHTGEKRGRGRPRKNAVPAMESSSGVQSQPAVKQEPATPPKNVADVPVLGEKRSRGRPRKSATPVAAAMPVVGVKRSRGRPPKIKNALNLAATLGARPNGKRRPGRPRKSVLTMGALQGSSGNAAVTEGMPGARRGRGRPPKIKLPARVTAAALAMLSLALGKRKRGRPPMTKRRPGRPTKNKPLQLGPVLAVDGALTKKGPGRPRMEKTVEDAPSEVGDAVVGEMTEAGPIETGAEAKPGQAVGATMTVQNGGEPSSLQSGGASLTQKRGRGRPRKEMLPENEPAHVGAALFVEKRPRGRPRKEKPSTASSAETGNDVSMGMNRGRGRPRKEKPSTASSAETGNDVSMGMKRGRGRPRKKKPSTARSTETGNDVLMGMKRGRGRPRKEKIVEVVLSEAGGTVVAVTTEAGSIEGVVEAEPIQAVGESGIVQNGDKASSLQSVGTSSLEKRGRGRPRKRKPSTISNKRGRGRPRKDRSFEIGFSEPAGQVSRDLTEAWPTKDGDLASGEKIRTEGILFEDGKETRTADAGCVMLSGENAASAAGDANDSDLGSM